MITAQYTFREQFAIYNKKFRSFVVVHAIYAIETLLFTIIAVLGTFLVIRSPNSTPSAFAMLQSIYLIIFMLSVAFFVLYLVSCAFLFSNMTQERAEIVNIHLRLGILILGFTVILNFSSYLILSNVNPIVLILGFFSANQSLGMSTLRLLYLIYQIFVIIVLPLVLFFIFFKFLQLLMEPLELERLMNERKWLYFVLLWFFVFIYVVIHYVIGAFASFLGFLLFNTDVAFTILAAYFRPYTFIINILVRFFSYGSYFYGFVLIPVVLGQQLRKYGIPRQKSGMQELILTKCPSCGKEVTSSDIFCPHCGEKLQ